ncbi:MAG TPA: HEAT repeat domain-containing protein [Chloroflexia bacterium]|nr:HEAT repeat domain-containing protein [Chloroflexia bacterium]
MSWFNLTIIAALEQPVHAGVRWLLLEAVGATRSSAVVSVLEVCLRSSDSELWSWAIRALREIDTKESRRTLWEAQSYVFPSEQETIQFQQHLAEVLAEQP